MYVYNYLTEMFKKVIFCSVKYILVFRGKGGTDNKEYEVTLEFFKEIKPEVSI